VQVKLDTRHVTGYTLEMILSFKHKGLEHFFKNGKKPGIQAKHTKRIQLILGLLNAATSPDDMRLPGLFLRSLSGKRADIWSVRVSGNWRITFRFTDKDAEIVDYEDYH
jgi:proteic killer suppression protein